ncbi:AcrR family transcriptional regulator [Pasteurellaceae bacterium Orientalotternb1]|nr:AcrR family transcriptional regulator [Pasteurellaceae bacterium Orientalotternb1]
MNAMTTPQNEMALRILKAADELMAKVGMHNISTHKIAKEAGVSVGTIYLYFKDKDELLKQLILHLFDCYHRHTQQAFDSSLSTFEQYCALWRSTWQFMQANPNVVLNFYQYELLPNYQETVQSCIENVQLVWSQCVSKGISQGEIVNLDRHILFAMTMRVAWDIMRQQTLMKKQYSEAEIEEMMLRTWKSISL